METTAAIYRIILLGHIASAIVGFGALISHGSYHARAVRSRPRDAARLLETTSGVAKTAEYGIYGVLAFGILLVALSDDVYRYSEGWISAAFVIWFVIVGLVHGLIRPARKGLVELTGSLAERDSEDDRSAAQIRSSDDAETDLGHEDLADLEAARPLIGRLAIGEAGVQLLVVAALVLMVWKPGH